MSKMKYAHYVEVSPERDVIDDAFSKGKINFKWNLSSMFRWNPYRSFFKMKILLSKANGNSLEIKDEIAPNMFIGHNFWSQMNIKCNSVKVSEIPDKVSQVSALRERYSIPTARRSTLLKDMNYSSSDIYERINQVSYNGFIRKDAVFEPFSNLFQANGLTVANDDQILVNAPLNVIQYTDNTGVAPGDINLTQSDLKIGDTLRINVPPNNVDVYKKVIGITADTITIDSDLVAFGATPIIIDADSTPNVIYYSKTPITRQTKEFEIIFKPCMGLFSVDNYLPGDWWIEMYPHVRGKFEKYVIESITDAIPVPLVNANFQVQVKDLKLHIWKGMTSEVANGEKKYEFTEIRNQIQTITDNNLTNKTFTVMPTTHTLTLAFQKIDAGDRSDYSRTRFKCLNDEELNLEVYQLRMDGKALPQPTPSIEYDRTLNTNRDYTSQYYYEQLMYLSSYYLDDPESLKTWQDRGAYYSLQLKEKISSSNRVVISTKFSALTENISLLLFDHYYKSFVLVCDQGLVSKVIVS